MKKALLTIVALLSLSTALSAAQTQGTRPANFPPNPSVSSKRGTETKTNALDAKTEQQANHPTVSSAKLAGAETDATTEAGNDASDVSLKTTGIIPTASNASDETPTTQPASDIETKKSEPPVAAKPEAAKAEPTKSEPAPAVPSTPLAPTSIYRVGVGDVLDIQLLNSPTRESTLYTVLAGGMLEYPLASEPLKVEGLTTDEIKARLAPQIKIYENPQIAVSVREYASHNVIITGLVHDPGTKPLRREAVPLFVVLAEAQPRADAARAVIMRSGSPSQTIDLSDTTATNMLVYPNDVIRLVAAPPPAPLFFYIGGQIVAPGQKDFHQGLTLTQSIFASGGMTRFAGSKAKVMRQGADGRLVTTEYNLKKIEQGKDPDPQLEAGDRIEITRSGW